MLLPLPFSHALEPLPRVVRLRWRDAVEALGLGRVGATRCANCRAETGQGEILRRMRGRQGGSHKQRGVKRSRPDSLSATTPTFDALLEFDPYRLSGRLEPRPRTSERTADGRATGTKQEKEERGKD